MTDSISPTPSNSLVPANEPERLAALYRYHILDTPAEVAFDRVTTLAARLFKVPTVLISLVDESRAWFKSSIGFDASEVPRDATLCSFAVLTDEPLIVPDTQLDERFACNPFVQCEPGLRFYAGAPLLSHDGYNLGTLCLLDTQPREPLSTEQQATLVDLAAIVVDELELRLAAQQIARVDEALLEITRGVARVTGDAFAEALVLHFAKVLDTDYVYIGLIEGDNPKRCALLGETDVKSYWEASRQNATRPMMRTIATCARGRIVDNLEYPLQDTPCWEAILHGRGSANEQHRICCYPRNVQAKFPNAPLLKALDVESYVATPFYNDRGEVLGVLGVMDGKPLENVHLAESLLTIFADRIATEIDRQQTERDLRESQALAQSQLLEIEAIYQTAPIGLAILDAELRYQHLNQGLAEINGIASEDHIGRTVREIVPNLADEIEPLLRRVLETGEPLLNLEISGETNAQPGVCRTWIANWYPLTDETGRSNEINVVVQEITDRKIAEASLKQLSADMEQQLQRFDAVASAVPDFIYTFDLDGRFTYINKPLLDLWQKTFAEAVGKNFYELDYPIELAQRLQDQIHQTIATRQPIKDETPYTSFTEGTRAYEYVFVPLLAIDGTIAGVAGITRDITDLKQAVASLEQSNARFHAAMQAVEGIVFEWHLQTQTVYRSEGLFDLIGVRTEDAQPTREWWTQRVHPDDLSRIESELPPNFAGIERYECEYRVRHEAGQWIYVWERSYFQYNSQGEVVSVVGFTADISRRKQIEADLRQSQEIAQRQLMEIEAIYQTAPIGLTILDADLRFERVNQRLAEINGISISEHIGRTVREIVPDLSEQNEPLLQQVLATGEPLLNVELSGTTPAQPGVDRTWIENCYPLKDETGRSIGINVVVQEITDRKIAETALQQSKAQLEFLLEAAEFGDWNLNLIDHTAYRSLRHDRIFGYETLLSEWTYEMFLDHVLPEDRAQADLKYQNAIDNNQPWDFECRICRTDNQVRWIWVSGYVYHNAAGKASRMLGLVADITDRKRAEAALTERNQELDSFVHVVSHDLKAPLRAISNLSQWLEDDLEDRLPSNNQQQFQLLRDRVKRMESMIDNLLVYARAGRQQAPTDTFNVAELLDEILDSLPIPPSFTMTISPPLPTLTTNRLFLSQVLTNLISNAVKHHPSADGHLDIAAIDRGDYYEFILKDDGAGIAPEHHAQIFTIFQTLKIKDNTDSTGVGLAIVKKIVETEGGTIRLESSLGAGTTFYISWPKIHS